MEKNISEIIPKDHIGTGFGFNIDKKQKPKLRFTTVPFIHKNFMIGRCIFMCPTAQGGHISLDIPKNISRHDLKIILAQLDVVKMSIARN